MSIWGWYFYMMQVWIKVLFWGGGCAFSRSRTWVEMAILFPLTYLWTFAENWLSVSVRPTSGLSVRSHWFVCLSYTSSTLSPLRGSNSPEVRVWETSLPPTLLFASKALGLVCVLLFIAESVCPFPSKKEASWHFDGDCTNPINQSGKRWHLKHLV